MADPRNLTFVYEGWEGYNRSLVHAVEGLTPEQLAYRGSSTMRSVGEVFLHIADGRVEWLRRIAPEIFDRLSKQIETRSKQPETSQELGDWLQETWEYVAKMLAQWTVEDLPETYLQPYQGKTYAVSRQWVIWRIMTHDVHHGGQLSELLAMQGILPLELTLLGGHLTEPEVVS